MPSLEEFIAPYPLELVRSSLMVLTPSQILPMEL